MTIRSLKAEDKEPLRKLLWETNSFRSDEIEVAMELVEENLSKQGKLTPEDYHIAVSFNDESKTVEGYVCFGKTPMTISTFDLYWIAVHPKAQGKGLGKKLFFYAEMESAKMGGRLFVIETSSQPKYEATRQFYERIGCTLEATIRDFYDLGDDKLIYSKRIEGHTIGKDTHR
ncbi:MAG: GNAT family N-acetyltransferase [Chloroherpetonaceae bacterium]|nr:GNAT family N-acetyltransferase [Chloroherpetonaceae bacterium]